MAHDSNGAPPPDAATKDKGMENSDANEGTHWGADATMLPVPGAAPTGGPAAENATQPGDTSGAPPRSPVVEQSASAETAMPLYPPGAWRGASQDGLEGPLVIGQPFGTRYQITDLLGIGGMGVVYRAWDRELGVHVAVKVIRPEIAADPVAAAMIEQRFKRELLLARQITHPNIIRIHDLGDINGIKYITMPVIEGADLTTLLQKEKKLGISRALRIARGTVAGLVSAHQAGVIHRDLKPANIMIDGDDAPTIMDFGIARSSGHAGQALAPAALGVRPADSSRTAVLPTSTLADAIVGTISYMAPEQARGGDVDHRADIYAVGLILYDMLVGGRRFERAPDALVELQQRMASAPPPPRGIDPAIPETLDAIICRCLQPDPTRRFQTTVDLQRALQRLDDGGRQLPIMRRVSRRTLTAAAAVVALLLGGTYYTASQFATPADEPSPVSVVIADFRNNTNDATFDNVLAPAVRRGLEGASFINAYDRSRVSALGEGPLEAIDENGARALAVRQGLGVVVAGSIDARGSGYDIVMRAAHAISGEVITTIRNSASSKNQVLDAVTKGTATLRKVLGDPTSHTAQLFAMRTISASSLEVVSHYAAAIDAQALGKFEEARQSYLRALAIDPQFGLGYQGLAAMARNQFRNEEADRYSKEALRYLDGMTERERFATRAFYYSMTSDNERCVREYGELLARYPADSVAHSQRAVCLRRLRRMREAVAAMQEAVEMLPNHVGYRINLALIANYAGDFETAEREARRLRSPDPRVLVALVNSQVGRGLVQEATQTYSKLQSMGARMASFAIAGLGDLDVYRGRFAQAVHIFDDGAAADLAANEPERAAIKFTSMAHAHLLAGRRVAAAAAADRALATSQTMSVRFLAGRVFVGAGALDKARELVELIPASSGRSLESEVHSRILEAEIALAVGDPRHAIQLLTAANERLDTWLGHYVLGRAYLQAGSLEEADSEFSICITRRGEALSLLDEGPTFGHFPEVYYYRGRVRQGLKTAASADAYQEYLRIRGESTEDPLVSEISKRTW